MARRFCPRRGSLDLAVEPVDDAPGLAHKGIDTFESERLPAGRPIQQADVVFVDVEKTLGAGDLEVDRAVGGQIVEKRNQAAP